MRKLFLAAAALGLLLGSSACTGEKPAAPPVPSAAPSAAPADVALSKDTKAICKQADRTSAAFGNTYLADLKLQLDAKSKGARAQADAKQKISQDVSNYSYALADMSKLAADPALKSALKQMSKQITVLAGDTSKINAGKMSRLSGSLDKACGKG